MRYGSAIMETIMPAAVMFLTVSNVFMHPRVLESIWIKLSRRSSVAGEIDGRERGKGSLMTLDC